MPHCVSPLLHCCLMLPPQQCHIIASIVIPDKESGNDKGSDDELGSEKLRDAGTDLGQYDV